MDDLAEAGLDLELTEFGKRLDSLLIARGWNTKARRGRRPSFAFSARQHAPNSVHVLLDAVVPEATAREIMAVIARHGLTAPPEENRPARTS